MAKLREILIQTFVFVVQVVVQSYTYLTLPVYYLIQKPYKKLELATAQRSKQLDPNDPYSPWVRLRPTKFHVLTTSRTMAEALDMMRHLYSPQRLAIGYRKILEEKVVTDGNGNAVRVDGKVLRKFRLSDYQWMTYREVIDRVDCVARGLLVNGFERHQRIVMLAETCADNLMFVQSLISIGTVFVTVFATLGDEGIIYAINETNSSCIYTTYDLLPKVYNLLSRCPKITAIIYVDSQIQFNNHNKKSDFPQNIKLWSISELINDGKEAPKELKGVPLEANDIQSINYTSGTTGEPKGIFITCGQFMRAGIAVTPAMEKFMDESERHIFVAYLPQSHVLEASIEMYAFLGGCRIGFATPFTLNESAPGLADGQICDIKLLKPTIMISVPLVLDRMRKEIYHKLNARTPVSADVFTFLTNYKTYWTEKGYETPIVNSLVCPKVRAQFGGKLEHMVVGGAPLSPQLQALIKASLNVTLVNGYGTTETFGAVICMDDDDLSLGRCGAPLKDIQIKLIDWTEGGYNVLDKPNPRGEIVVGGYGVASGYYNKPQLTEESFYLDSNGMNWFSTGDIAEVFPDGTFKIIDRKKDLIKLANGEFFSLGKIESVLKNCPYVENICVIANPFAKRLVALVMPHYKALEILSKDLNLSGLQLRDLCEKHGVIEAIHKAIVEIGLRYKLNRKEIPTKIIITPEEWTPDNGMLTAALKLKRINITHKYKVEIEKMFS